MNHDINKIAYFGAIALFAYLSWLGLAPSTILLEEPEQRATELQIFKEVKPLTLRTAANDPFRREAKIRSKKVKTAKGHTKQAFPYVKIQGTATGTEGTVAIINNKVRKVGDRIGKVKIIAINEKEVTMQYLGLIKTKKVKTPNILADPKSGKSLAAIVKVHKEVVK